MHFHVELTVKMDTQVANCAGAFDSRAAHGESVWECSTAVVFLTELNESHTKQIQTWRGSTEDDGRHKKHAL